MKFSKQVLFVGLLVSATLVAGAQKENLNEDHEKLQGIIDVLVNNTINALLEKIEDPIKFDHLSFNFTEEFLNGEANISNFKFYGLKNLTATKINVGVFSLAMNATIVIPHIQLNTQYYADVTLAELIPLFGNGQINVTIDGIELLVSGKVNITGGLSLSNVTVSFSLGTATFDLQGLLNNEEFNDMLNELLNEDLVAFVNDNQEDISNIISPLAGAIINSLLSHVNNSTQQNELEETFPEAGLHGVKR